MKTYLVRFKLCATTTGVVVRTFRGESLREAYATAEAWLSHRYPHHILIDFHEVCNLTADQEIEARR